MEGLYLFYGQESYLLEDYIKKIKNSFDKLIEGINLIKIDGTDVNQLISNIETPCFGFDRKLIIIKNSGLFKKETKGKNTNLVSLIDMISEYIKENIEIVKQNNVVVFVEKEVDKNKLYKVIEEYGKIINFEPEKLSDLIKRIKRISTAYKVDISEYNCQYLVECCGTNLQDIINELRKLIEYVGEGGKIEKNEIDMLTTKHIDSVIFDLTDNLGKKNIKNALTVFNSLIYQKEPIQRILITLYNHFKKLYFVKIALEYNKDIIEILRLKPNQTFLVSKYKTQAGYFSEIELRYILKELSDLDYNYKIGLMDLNIGIEAILCRYCGK